MTDGRSDAGVQPVSSIAPAVDTGISVFLVVIGGIELPSNIEVAGVQAPPRVLPSNKFQSNGIERQTKVLFIACGPHWAFGLLRNQLCRVKDIRLHDWLRSAKPGTDRESGDLLFDFPPTHDDAFFHDCIIAFDPDWREFTPAQCGCCSIREFWRRSVVFGLDS